MLDSKGDKLADEIVENLYLGSLGATDIQSKMDDLGITHVLSLGIRAVAWPRGLVGSLFIAVSDTVNSDIERHLPRAVEFIERALEYQNGKVLVHCMAGKSRSGSCVIAYIMKTRQMTYIEA